MTTLVSHYGSDAHKGKVMGTFRSLGALARAVGPIFASICNICSYIILISIICIFNYIESNLFVLFFSILVYWSKDNILYRGSFITTTMVFIKKDIERDERKSIIYNFSIVLIFIANIWKKMYTCLLQILHKS